MKDRNINNSIMREIRQNLDSYAFSGLVSEDLGIGTGADKLTSFNDYAFRPISATASRRIYANGDVLQNIFDIPSLDATREGFTLKSDYDDQGASKIMTKRLMELDVEEVMRQHLTNTDLYSRGSYILPVIKETLDFNPKLRLSVNSIERVQGLNLLTEDEVDVQFNVTNAADISYLKPNCFYVQGSPYDPSRIRWNTYKFFPSENQGVSLLHKVLLACLALRVTNWSLANVMLEVQNKVLKVSDLDSYALQDSITPDFRNSASGKREGIMASVKRWLTSSKMMVIDKDDEYTRNMYSATGVKEATDFFWEFLSAVSNRPQAVIKGQATGTISSSDTDSLRYAESIRSKSQMKVYKPFLEYLINILKFEQRGEFYRKFGYEGANINFEIDFNPIWQPDAKESAQIKLLNSQRGQIDIATGVRDSEQVRRENYPTLFDEPLPEMPDGEGIEEMEKQNETYRKMLEN